MKCRFYEVSKNEVALPDPSAVRFCLSLLDKREQSKVRTHFHHFFNDLLRFSLRSLAGCAKIQSAVPDYHQLISFFHLGMTCFLSSFSFPCLSWHNAMLVLALKHRSASLPSAALFVFLCATTKSAQAPLACLLFLSLYYALKSLDEHASCTLLTCLPLCDEGVEIT